MLVLAGSAYDDVSLRDVLLTSSSVPWNETYTAPGVEIGVSGLSDTLRDADHAFAAEGIHGQFMYINPAEGR